MGWISWDGGDESRSPRVTRSALPAEAGGPSTHTLTGRADGSILANSHRVENTISCSCRGGQEVVHCARSLPAFPALFPGPDPGAAREARGSVKSPGRA